MKRIEVVEVLHGSNPKEMNRLLLRMFSKYIEETPTEELMDTNILYISSYTKMKAITNVLNKHNKFFSVDVDVYHPVDRTITSYVNGSIKKFSPEEFFKLYGDYEYVVFVESPNLKNIAESISYLRDMFVSKLTFSCFENKFNISMRELFGDRIVRARKKFTDKGHCSFCDLDFESIEFYYDLPHFCPSCDRETSVTKMK